MRIRSILVRGIAGALLALVTGVTLSMTVATPASAETLNNNCEGGELCLYYSTSYTGALADMYDNVADYSGWHFANSSLWLNDNTWSGKSNSIWSFACVSEHPNYGGKMFFRADGGRGSTDFGAWRDKASSHRFLFTCAYN